MKLILLATKDSDTFGCTCSIVSIHVLNGKNQPVDSFNFEIINEKALSISLKAFYISGGSVVIQIQAV